jgi:hypothetical protein
MILNWRVNVFSDDVDLGVTGAGLGHIDDLG